MGFSGTARGPRPSEEVLLLPTCGVYDPRRGVWRITLQVWVYALKRESLLRQKSMSLFCRAAGLALSDEDMELYEERALLFLADNKGRRRLTADISGKIFELQPTCSNGRSETVVEFEAGPLSHSTLPIKLVTARGDYCWEGQVYLPSTEGLSIVSDIDDTIKITEVGDRSAVLKNTFLKPFQPVEGIATVYRRWARNGALFHYVSASPWQLYPPLAKFMQQAEFPGGSFHLRRMRWKDRSMLNLFRSSDRLKRVHIEQLLHCYPKRKFVLVGDTGEGDPELFGELARRYPQQIIRAVLRRTDKGRSTEDRLRQAFGDVFREKRLVFDEADELLRSDITAAHDKCSL